MTKTERETAAIRDRPRPLKIFRLHRVMAGYLQDSWTDALGLSRSQQDVTLVAAARDKRHLLQMLQERGFRHESWIVKDMRLVPGDPLKQDAASRSLQLAGVLSGTEPAVLAYRQFAHREPVISIGAAGSVTVVARFVRENRSDLHPSVQLAGREGKNDDES